MRTQKVRMLQGFAACAAIFTAIYNIFLSSYVEDYMKEPPMLEAIHVAATSDRERLMSFISDRGGAWSSDVDTRLFQSQKSWKAGESGVLAVTFNRLHKECPLGVFRLRLVGPLNMAVQLVEVNIATVYGPLGQNILVSPATVPADTPTGAYDVIATITEDCSSGERSVGFPPTSIIIQE